MRLSCARICFSTVLGLALSCGSDEPSDMQSAPGTLGLYCDSKGIEVGEVSFTVARAGATVRAGTFSIRARQDGFSATIGPLPAGDDYTIDLSAKPLQRREGLAAECSGDGGFSVAPEQTTVVTIQLNCGAMSEKTASDNNCPKIDSVRAVPAEAFVGESLSLRADAHDLDRKLMPLQFTWSARAGVLTDELLSRAYYMCTVAGRHAITLKISDGDEECPEESVTIQVNCRKPLEAGSGASMIGAGTAGRMGSS